jgi:hypothetical protein
LCRYPQPLALLVDPLETIDAVGYLPSCQLTSTAVCDTNVVFLVTLVDADEQHDLFSFLVIPAPIGDYWPLLAYYGTPGAMYFRQIVPVGLGDDPGKALVVLAL